MGKFCSGCGTKLNDNAQFCANCGEAVSNNETINNTTYVSKSSEGKSRIAAGILGILLGSLGVHNFYLGYTGKGVAQLLLTILSCGFLSFVSYIWGLVEGIQILTGSINVDASGNKLVD